MFVQKIVTKLFYGILFLILFFDVVFIAISISVTSGQSYKHFTIVKYDSRVIPDLKLPHITTLES